MLIMMSLLSRYTLTSPVGMPKMLSLFKLASLCSRHNLFIHISMLSLHNLLNPDPMLRTTTLNPDPKILILSLKLYPIIKDTLPSKVSSGFDVGAGT